LVSRVGVAKNPTPLALALLDSARREPEHDPMRKPIPTKVHGVLDYMTAAFLHTLPRVMGWSDNVTRVLDVAGAGATGYSLMTDYELGLVRALPMKAHLTLDALSGGALIAAALVMVDEDDEVRATLAGIGAWEIAASLLTRTGPDGDAGRAAAAGKVESGAWSQQSMPAAPTREFVRPGVGEGVM
jgi:hypothetical protein